MPVKCQGSVCQPVHCSVSQSSVRMKPMSCTRHLGPRAASVKAECSGADLGPRLPLELLPERADASPRLAREGAAGRAPASIDTVLGTTQRAAATRLETPEIWHGQQPGYLSY